MPSELLIALIAGLGAMLGWGLADFFAKKTIDKLGDVPTLFWALTIGVGPLILLYVSNPMVPEKLHDLGYLSVLYFMIIGAWSGLSYVLLYVGFGKGKVSILSPIFASYAAVVAIISATFFGEVIPGGHVVALIVTFAGALIISGDLKRLFQIVFSIRREREEVRGLKEVLIAVLLYSPWLIALDQFIGGEYWVPFLLGIRMCAAITIFVYARVRGISLVVKDTSLWKYLIAIGCADVAAFAFLAWGYSASPHLSIVTMLSAAFSLPTMVLAIIFLKERITRIQVIGGLVVVAGAMLLALL